MVLYSYYLTAGSQDLKETSCIKSSFIHATRGGWEQLPILKDQLLESQEKLLKAYKELLALEDEKKEREAALAEAREASRKAVEEAVLLRERTMMVEEAASKAGTSPCLTRMQPLIWTRRRASSRLTLPPSRNPSKG